LYLTLSFLRRQESRLSVFLIFTLVRTSIDEMTLCSNIYLKEQVKIGKLVIAWVDKN